MMYDVIITGVVRVTAEYEAEAEELATKIDLNKIKVSYSASLVKPYELVLQRDGADEWIRGEFSNELAAQHFACSLIYNDENDGEGWDWLIRRKDDHPSYLSLEGEPEDIKNGWVRYVNEVVVK